MSGGEDYEIEAHEIDRTVLSVAPLDRQWLSSFPHISDLEFFHRAGPIDLILGVQYSHLHAEEEIRQGLKFEPVGKKTPLGWFVIGPDSTPNSKTSVSAVMKDRLDLSKMYDFETLGVRAPSCSCPLDVMSKEDKKVMEMFTSSCHKERDRYVMGLPWKKDPSLLPNNLPLAEKRLTSLERSLSKNPNKATMYDKVVKEYIEKGWAVQVNQKESVVGPVYYLPHYGIYRPEKVPFESCV